MEYLKLTNVPIVLTRQPKYGNGNKMAWENCGFNTTIVSRKALQYYPGGIKTASGIPVTVLPISDRAKFDIIWPVMEEDISLLNSLDPDTTAEGEIIDEASYQLEVSARDAAKAARAAQ